MKSMTRSPGRPGLERGSSIAAGPSSVRRPLSFEASAESERVPAEPPTETGRQPTVPGTSYVRPDASVPRTRIRTCATQAPSVVGMNRYPKVSVGDAPGLPGAPEQETPIAQLISA